MSCSLERLIGIESHEGVQNANGMLIVMTENEFEGSEFA